MPGEEESGHSSRGYSGTIEEATVAISGNGKDVPL
jgi:hypothetical protein